jgi:hypothetical protein
MVKWQMPMLLSNGQGAVILGEMLVKIIGQALRDKGLLCRDEPCAANGFSAKESIHFAAAGDTVNGVVQVNNLDAGAVAIRAELEGIAALQFCEIAWLDWSDGQWHRWHGDDSQGPFSATPDRLRMWVDRFEALKRKSP